MRRIVFFILILIIGGVIALGLEWVAAQLPGQVSAALLRLYGVGIHPLSVDINACGLVGLILGYLTISKFVKK